MSLLNKHYLRLTIIAQLLLLLNMSLVGQSPSELSKLKNEFATASNDSTKVKLLFSMGNCFIDGPSDSLMFYYQKALVIINDKLSFYEGLPNTDIELIKKYRQFELRVYIEFGIEYFFRSDYSKALEYYFKALAIAEELDDKEVISECHSEIAIVYKNQGKYDLALEHNESALYLSRFLNDSSWTASCYANQGTIYLKKGYFTLALNNYLTALKTFEDLGNRRRMGYCYLNVGIIYAGQHDYSSAKKYYSLALNNAKQTGNKMNAANSYLSIGEAWLYQKQPGTARMYLDSALLTLKESGYSHGMDDCFTLLGDSWKQEHQYKKAKEYYLKSLKLSETEGDMPGMAESFNNLAEIEYLENNLQEAQSYVNRSLDNARETGNLEALEAAWSLQAKISEALGDDKKALAAFKKYSIFKDSLFSESKYKSIRETEAKFETEKKEQQLALLTEKNEVQQLKLSRRFNLLLASGIGILLVLFISYLLIRQNRIKSKHKAIELEQRLLRSQMNPHFIFNSLIAIQSYIYKSEPLEAGDFLAKFADLVRLTLEHSRVEYVLLSEERKMLTAYLDLQMLRFENRFDFGISFADDLDAGNIKIPPMFAQPFIENAIEHGLRHKKEKGHLKITYSLKSEHCVEIVIEDDGVGRDKARDIEKKKQHQSLAIEITKERLSILNKRYKHKFKLDVTDLKDEYENAGGTRVRIILPYRNQ